MINMKPEISVKDRVRGRLASAGNPVAVDLKEANIRTTINQVEKTDGKITANFNVDGIPTKEAGRTEYKSFPKIFDNFAQFTTYAENFFNMSDEQIIELCKKEKTNTY